MSYKTVLFFILALGLLGGCSATTRNLDPSSEAHYDAGYDFSDKKQIVEKLTAPLVSGSVFPATEKKPVLIFYPVVNQTSEHISTGGITDDIRMRLLRSGRFRFINERQRNNIKEEINYQAGGMVDPAMRVEQGRQLGA